MYYPQHLVHRFKPLKTPLCLYPVPSPLFALTQVTRHATWLALSLILLSPWQLKVFGVLGISLYQSSVLHALYQSFIVKYFTWNLDITFPRSNYTYNSKIRDVCQQNHNQIRENPFRAGYTVCYITQLALQLKYIYKEHFEKPKYKIFICVD